MYEPLINYGQVRIILDKIAFYLKQNNMEKILEIILILVPTAGSDRFILII